MKNSSKTANRLINEISPYLLQHANNPVDWYPWGEEAFVKARNEDKPIFLSIGYSCCHWCHVMERETFEDEEASQVLNDGFVSIKVDREERPDIDHIYMDICQAMTGGGGWPLSVFMDAEGQPFFTGTYFTNAQFIDLLGKIRDLWENGRDKLAAASDAVQKFLDAQTLRKEEANDGLPDEAYSALAAAFDGEFGGFSYAPKFPSPHLLLFLMRYAAVRDKPRAMEMAENTLRAMDRGGIHDHIGYGFCRYSTDRRWLAPHFEKMLYDNALLAYTYIEAFRQTGEERFRDTALTTLSYLSRVLRSPEGGFYTAEDADSEGEEGKFYLWTKKETEDLLGGGAAAFCTNYDITEGGNFEGKNIPNLIGNPLALHDLPAFEAERKILFAAREKRPHPFLDDKVLTCWNGLCMAAFAYAGRTLEDPALIKAAGDVWLFIRGNMTDGRGGLISSWRAGEGRNPGHADDYAYMVWGLLELFAATSDIENLSRAVRLDAVFMERFADEQTGALYYTDKDAEKLIARTRTGYDGAVPSANSVQAMNLLRLYSWTGDMKFKAAAEGIIGAFAGEAAKNPAAYAHMMSALLQMGREEAKVVVAGRTAAEMAELLSCARKAGAVAVPVAADAALPENLKEYFESYAPLGGRSAAYVCRGHACLPPVTDTGALIKLLENN
jgi:hypothetical protein